MPPHQQHRRVFSRLSASSRRQFFNSRFVAAEYLEDRVLLSGYGVTDLPVTDPGIGDESASEYFMTCNCPNCALVVQGTETVVAPAEGAAIPPFDLAQTFQLQSDPAANLVIYLDFDGHVTTNTSWNSYRSIEKIVTPAYDFDGDTSSFSNAELERIQRIWLRVVEDFAPFTVNVTTRDPGVDALRKSGDSDTRWGIRVVIGGSSTDWYGNAGGVAYVGSFASSVDTPAFVFKAQLGNGNEKYTAEAITHEVGHTLGLSHDGRISPNEGYYYGHGSGETGWAPIMGVGYNKELVQWSRGDSPYPSPNNTQDDLAIITGGISGLQYRADDVGNTTKTAKPLAGSGSQFSGKGLIERNTDVDFFSFTTSGGLVTIDVDPWSYSPNLDVLASLYNAAGTLILSSNPLATLNASLSAVLAAGTYYVSIQGTGKPDDGNGNYGYSDYGSLGHYTVAVSQAPPGVTVTSSQNQLLENASGTLRYLFQRSGDTTQSLTVGFSVTGTAVYGIDYSQTGATSFSRTSGTITFAAGQSTLELIIDPTADSLIEPDETIILTLTNGVGYVPGVPSTAVVTILNDDFQADDAYEVNNTLATAWPLPSPGLSAGIEIPLSTIGGLGVAMDDDWYRIEVPTGQRHLIVDLTFLHANGDLDLEVVDREGNIIAYSYGVNDNERIDVVLPFVGDWYLHVIPYEPQTVANTYDLVWSTDVPSTVSVTRSPSNVAENGTAELVYTFTRSGGTSRELSVDFSLGGTAVLGTDYTMTGATLLNGATGIVTFAAGSSTATVRVRPTADSVIESDETVVITLSPRINYELGATTSASGTIQNDDFDATPNVTSVRYGYANGRWIEAGSLSNRPSQTAPWQISKIEMTFDRNVVVDAADLVATGVSGGRLSIGSFSYSATTRTAVWTFVTPVALDQVSVVLDGDDAASDGNIGVRSATGTYPANGGYLTAGDLSRNLYVLQGDVNGDGEVNVLDALVQRTRSGTSDIWSDLNGDGTVDVLDALLLRLRSGTVLPVPSSSIPDTEDPTTVVLASPAVSEEPIGVPTEGSMEDDATEPATPLAAVAFETEIAKPSVEDAITAVAVDVGVHSLPRATSVIADHQALGTESDRTPSKSLAELPELTFVAVDGGSSHELADGIRAVVIKPRRGDTHRQVTYATPRREIELDAIDVLFGNKKNGKQDNSVDDFVSLSDLLLLST